MESNSGASQSNVGGGLGASPLPSEVIRMHLLPVEEMLPSLTRRLPASTRNGARKRIGIERESKFLVQDLGIDRFKELDFSKNVRICLADPRWTEFLDAAEQFQETPLRPAGGQEVASTTAAFQRWIKTNTRAQKQAGYVVLSQWHCPWVTLPRNHSSVL